MSAANIEHLTPGVSAGARRYLIVLILALLFGLVLIAGLLVLENAAGVLPPLPFTSNLSFNEKVAFLRPALRTHPDLLVAGSSMALNNLSGDVLVSALPGHPRILNLGAFSLKMGDTRRWLRAVLKTAHPKRVIVVTGMMDFYANTPWLTPTDGELSAMAAADRSPIIEFLRYFSFQYYIDKWIGLHVYRQSRADYGSLAFDGTGSVPLSVYYPNVDLQRWREGLHGDLVTDQEYSQASHLADELRGRNVQAVFVQPPLRLEALAAGRGALEKHLQRLSSIVNQHGQVFVDLHQMGFDDSFFADYSHLNEKGARTFTLEVAKRLLQLAE